MSAARFKHSFIFFLLFASVFLYGQDIASLQSKLKASSGKEKVDLYLKIGNSLSEQYGKPDSLHYYASLAYAEATLLKYDDGQKKAIFGIAIAYQKQDRSDTSIVILKKLLLSTDKDLNFTGDIIFNIGLNYRLGEDYKSATEYYLKAIQIYSKANNSGGLALTYSKLAGIFTMQRQFDVALNYCWKAQGIVEKAEPFTKIAVYSSFAGIYAQVGFKDSTMVDSLIYFAIKALKLCNENSYYTKGSQLCISVSQGYAMKKEHKKALEFCKQSMGYRNYLYPFEIVTNHINFSDCYFNLNEHKLSLDYLDSAKLVARVLKDPFIEMNIEERVYVYNKAAKNFDVALKGNERFNFLKDSLFNVEKSKAINELEQKYNKSENEKKISELNTKNEIASLRVKFLVVGIFASFLIILVIVFFYRQSILKNKFKALETEQRLNRARMNPHFFFNALASIQTLSMDAEHQSKVSSLISKFSKIMRQSLESTYDELATIEDEILFLSNYLDLQKTRFNNKFEYEISVDENLAQEELKIPSMLLQPFLENSMEHGFKNINYKGKLDIIFKKEENRISVELKDNGKGFDTSQKHKEYPSRATQIIADRLLILNKQHKSNSNYIIEPNSDGKGISVKVNLPIIF